VAYRLIERRRSEYTQPLPFLISLVPVPLMVATEVVAEVQVTVAVMFCVLLSP
jgi:hypothetical protein